MRFRTEIELPRFNWELCHDTSLLLLGSCFSDEIGTRLADDGFRVLHNPLGPLFNPLSVGKCLRDALSGFKYSESVLTYAHGAFHCLDYASRFSGSDAELIVNELNASLDNIRAAISAHPVLILTYGSAYVYERQGVAVGNCHKFPASEFVRTRLSVQEAALAMAETVSLVQEAGVQHIIITVSPVRHLDEGLHGNTLNKAVLHLAAGQVVSEFQGVDYFPAFEILNDDLRDYRFYGADMKHPSPVAVDYIYDIFCQSLMSRQTREDAAAYRRAALTAKHRPIL